MTRGFARAAFCSLALVLVVLSGSVQARTAASQPHTHSLRSVRLCLSVPRGFPPLSALANGIMQAVTMAEQGFRARFVRAGVALRPPLVLDYGSAQGFELERARQDARRCLSGANDVGYLGPINSDPAFVIEPILNRGGMLTVSPSTTNSILTDPATRNVQEPATFQRKIPLVTFYRLVSVDSMQGLGGIAYLHAHRKARTVYLVDDGQDYGKLLAGGVQRHSAQLGVRLVGVAHLDVSTPVTMARGVSAVADQVASSAPDLVYCGCDGESAAALSADLNARSYHGAFLGGDAILAQDWLQVANPLGSVFATNVGLDASRAAGWFRRQYQSRFHVAPEIYDAYAYDAAAIILQAAYTVIAGHQDTGGTTATRLAIIKYVRHDCFHGATGNIAFNGNGDTRNAIISVYTARQGEWPLVGEVRVGKAPVCR